MTKLTTEAGTEALMIDIEMILRVDLAKRKALATAALQKLAALRAAIAEVEAAVAEDTS